MTTFKVTVKNKEEELFLAKLLKENGLKFSAPKRPKGQKKGRSFEKEIAIELSKWMTEGKRDDIFYTSSGSGSRFTARQKQGKDTANSCGDISLLDPIGQPLLDFFSIEIKRGYSNELDLLSLVDSNNKNHKIIEWVTKAQKEVKEAGRQTFLIIIKRDHKNKVVVADSGFLNSISYNSNKIETEIYVKNDFSFGIINYEEFFKFFEPGDLK